MRLKAIINPAADQNQTIRRILREEADPMPLPVSTPQESAVAVPKSTLTA